VVRAAAPPRSEPHDVIVLTPSGHLSLVSYTAQHVSVAGELSGVGQ